MSTTGSSNSGLAERARTLRPPTLSWPTSLAAVGRGVGAASSSASERLSSSRPRSGATAMAAAAAPAPPPMPRLTTSSCLHRHRPLAEARALRCCWPRQGCRRHDRILARRLWPRHVGRRGKKGAAGGGASASAMMDRKKRSEKGGAGGGDGRPGDACTRPIRRRLQGRNWGENPIFTPVLPQKMGETPPPENRGESGHHGPKT